MERGRFFDSSLSALPEPEEGKRTMGEDSQEDDTNKEPGREDILWHFTPTPEALLSILKLGLFATHASDLSDGTDCLIRNRLLTALVDISRDATPALKSATAPVIERVKRSIEHGEFFPAFVISFSSDPLFRCMWENYTPNGGFAIGFSRSAVRAKVTPDRSGTPPFVSFENCNYDRYDNKSEQVGKIVDAIPKICQRLHEKHPNKSCQKLPVTLIPRVFRAALPLLFVKQWFFDREREDRLVTVLNEKELPQRMVVRGGKRRILHHFPGEPRNYVKRIIVSPKGDAEKNHKLALMIADKTGIPTDRIQPFEQSEFLNQPKLEDEGV